MPEVEAVWLRVRRLDVGWAVLSFVAKTETAVPGGPEFEKVARSGGCARVRGSRKSEVVSVGPLKGLS